MRLCCWVCCWCNVLVRALLCLSLPPLTPLSFSPPSPSCVGPQGTAPCLAVDNTSGCQLYLGPAALTTAVTTAKSSEVNVLVPGASADEELVRQKKKKKVTTNHIRTTLSSLQICD